MFFLKNRTLFLFALKFFVFLHVVKLVKTQMNIQDKKDPCTNFVCKWGGMCQLDSFGFPVCNCPLTCPYSVDVICSSYGVEFQSECEMHRFACTHVISISTKNKGKCHRNVSNYKTEACPSREDMRQFRGRYMGWIIVIKTIADNPSLTPTKRVDQLSLNEKIRTVEWHFTRYDKDNNGILDDQEIKTLLEVMKYEPCGYGFIRSCALVDGKQGITLEEWNICFNVAERPYERRH